MSRKERPTNIAKQAKTAEDKERAKKYRAEYYAVHAEQERELSKNWKKENRERWNRYQKEHRKEAQNAKK